MRHSWLSDTPTLPETGANDTMVAEKEGSQGEIPVEVQDAERASSSISADIGPAPDGGFIAWLQVIVGYFIMFNTWGLVNAFGAYQTYYDSVLPQSPSDIAWVGTFQGFMLLFLSAVAGPLYDKGYARHLVVTGGFLVTFGLMMTSLSTRFYQVFLAQGVTIGLGAGLMMIPSIAIVAQYFTTKRALAIGIVASGGSMGALLYPIVFNKLQSSAGFGWATRAIGFICLVTIAVSAIGMKPRFPPAKTARALIDTDAFRSPPFLLFSLAMFLYFMGIYMPFFYVDSWAQHNLGTSPDLSFYLFSILNAGSLFGRIIPGLLADRFGSLNLIVPTILITAMLMFAWMGVHSFGELVVFCIFYGFFSGASVSLPGTILSLLAPDLNKVGTWMGMCFGFASLGILVGNPIAGAILDGTKSGSYVPAQSFSGAVVLAGGLCLIGVRYMKGQDTTSWKV